MYNGCTIKIENRRSKIIVRFKGFRQHVQVRRSYTPQQSRSRDSTMFESGIRMLDLVEAVARGSMVHLNWKRLGKEMKKGQDGRYRGWLSKLSN